MGERKLGGAGEIVAVQGGHIVRSTGRKDRHSKVCTAKGPRDRRVRLAAHTAIQFYDVQDRLGYDRPSKAVDWLINKAKAAIDELEKLPAWNPTVFQTESVDPEIEVEGGRQRQRREPEDDLGISDVSGEDKLKLHGGGECEHRRSGVASNSTAQNSGGLPPSSLESDAIKFVLPFDGAIDACSSPFHFPRFSNPDFTSRTGSHTRDLKLSLQFQNPILFQNHHHSPPPPQPHSQLQVLLSGIPLGFETPATAFPDNHHHHQHQTSELRFQNLPSWNSGGDSAGSSFNSPSTQQLSGIEQLFPQRGPLQSSTTPSIRAWIDPISMAADHHQSFPPIHPPPSFSGFQIPARIQGDEHEQDDGFRNKPLSSYSNSRSIHRISPFH